MVSYSQQGEEVVCTLGFAATSAPSFFQAAENGLQKDSRERQSHKI